MTFPHGSFTAFGWIIGGTGRCRHEAVGRRGEMLLEEAAAWHAVAQGISQRIDFTHTTP